MGFNIFQGDERLLRIVCRVLGYEENEENTAYGWFTEDIYFSTFFYLTKRFGGCQVFDDYKDAGVWNFEVKDYTIQIYMNSSWVQFIIYGRKGNITVHSPYIVKVDRERIKKRAQMVRLHTDEKTDVEMQILQEQFELFQLKEGFKGEEILDEQFKERYGMAWYEWMDNYNNNIIDVDYDEFTAKYGKVYSNSYTRHALKTLDQFLKNLLTPFWVRDVPYNLKGRMTDEEARFYERFENNIIIKFKQ